MISDEGQPILMDFGSCRKARVKVENRSMALLEQVRVHRSVVIHLTACSETMYFA